MILQGCDSGLCGEGFEALGLHLLGGLGADQLGLMEDFEIHVPAAFSPFIVLLGQYAWCVRVR